MHPLRILLALVATTSLAAAQIPLPGTVFDGSGGPLLSGNVYTAGLLIVPAGQTLTIQAGAILKMTGSRFIVDGTLIVQGTTANPAYITAIKDDTVGGDTNGDGAGSLPAAGQWDGIELRGGSHDTVIDHAVIRYHGAGGWAGVYISSSTVTATITHCEITDGSSAGINLVNQDSHPVISHCNFMRNDGAAAVANARIDSVPFITDNTASDNDGGDFIYVGVPTPLTDVSIAANNCLGGALVFAGLAIVPTDAKLTLGPDVVVKTKGSRLIVDGTIELLGTAGHPVVVTSYPDDTIAGDTNKDGGATAPAPGNWDGIELRGGSHDNVIDHAVIRYHGAGGWAGVYISSAGITATITNSEITDGSAAGINLANTLSYPVISHCNFMRNDGAAAVTNVRIDSVPFMTDNTASDNDGGDFIFVGVPTPAADVVIGASNCLQGALVFAGLTIVPTDMKLTLGPDVVIKTKGSRLIVDGTIELLGSAGHPVVVTTYLDDAIAGDTNKDGGSTVPAPGNWDGIELRGVSHDNVIDHAVIRYHGAGGWAGVYVNGNGITATITNSEFTDGSAAGINLANTLSYPVIDHCNFMRNDGAAAVANARIDSVPFITDNTASDNAGGNFIFVSVPSPLGEVTVAANNCLGGALVFAGLTVVPVDASLTLQPGVVVKTKGSRLIVDGGLDLLGVPNAPVVITSYGDDSVAGDTNLDGSTTVPAPANWDGIELRAGSVSHLESALVRYSGAGGWQGVYCRAGSDAALHNVRVEHSAGGAFRFEFNGTVQAADLTAWACDTGFDLSGGTFTLKRSTAAGCAGFGIRAQPQFTGEVHGCVAWGNGTDFLGLLAGQASWCDGSTGLTGGTGNISANPLFVDAAHGNVRPSPGSPVIEAGDPSEFLSGQDLATFPRFTDGNLDKVRRVDMGAYEYDGLELTVSAVRHPGESLDILTTDHEDFADLWMFVGTNFGELDAHRFGTLFVDLLSPSQILFWPKVPQAIPIIVPPSIPLGTQFVFQVGGRKFPAPGSPGNLSNPVIATIE